jgi:hypothetical protein
MSGLLLELSVPVMSVHLLQFFRQSVCDHCIKPFNDSIAIFLLGAHLSPDFSMVCESRVNWVQKPSTVDRPSSQKVCVCIVYSNAFILSAVLNFLKETTFSIQFSECAIDRFSLGR